MADQSEEIVAERFWAKVAIPANVLSDCWEWTAATSHGYGRLTVNQQPEAAHRMAFRMVNGPLRKDEVVIHRCDNKRCVNPTHLAKGTQADNMRDKVSKGRQQKGDRCPKAKLTDEKVREMRQLYSAGFLQKDLAKRYGIDGSTVSGIVTGRHWRHVV